MLRRLFYLLPDEGNGPALIADLNAAGIGPERLHAATGGGRLLQQLPPATARQQHDRVWQLQQRLWSGNLVLFGIAAVVLAIALATGYLLTALVGAVVMVAALTAGLVFIYRMPPTHLGEFNIALQHGDVVLMVDVPKPREAEIAQLIRRRHPEAEASGVGWSIPALGL
jgi:hypothetical protein